MARAYGEADASVYLQASVRRSAAAESTFMCWTSESQGLGISELHSGSDGGPVAGSRFVSELAYFLVIPTFTHFSYFTTKWEDYHGT